MWKKVQGSARDFGENERRFLDVKISEQREMMTVEILWYFTLFMQLVESVVSFSVSLFLITYVCCALLLVKILFFNYRDRLKEICCSGFIIIKQNRICFFLLCAYSIFDIISFLYTEDVIYASLKYIVAGEMIFFLIMYFLILILKKENIQSGINKLLLSISLSGLVVSIIAVSNYFWEYIPLIYVRRLSTIMDYNQFATIILLGCISGIWLILRIYGRLEEYFFKRVVSIVSIFYIIFELSVAYLAGSRRIFLIESVFICFLAGLLVYFNVRYKKDMFCCLAIIVTTILGIVCFSNCMERVFDYNYENGKHSLLENDINSNMNTIFTGEAGGKRMAIWSIALEEFSQYSLTEKLIGKGASYQSDIYDMEKYKKRLIKDYSANEFTKKYKKHWMYPHNFLLADLLSGGWLKFLLSLSLFITIIFYVLNGILSNYQLYFVGGMIGITYFNAFLSYPYGVIADKNWWIGLLIVILFRYIKERNFLKGEQENAV